MARRVISPDAPLPEAAPYPGHFALVRSVVEGLRAIGAEFTFNPGRVAEVGGVVYAPANEALTQAIAWKTSGRIQRLVAGPTNAFNPHECDDLILHSAIDRLIVASDWVRDLYRQEVPELADKLRVAPAGIDPEYWRPRPRAGAGGVLVYQKDVDEATIAAVCRHVTDAGLAPRVFRYGQYLREEFKAALDQCSLAIFLSTFETQGLALAETWAMDVPTLVWDPQEETEWRGFRFRAGSSAPYLTPTTGQTWKTIPELAALLAAGRDRARFAPRAWVLDHMTDAVCARALYRVLTEG